LSLYSSAYKLTKNDLFKEIVEKTTSFVEKEWFTNLGGFYSALDADSNNRENQLEEGAFYVWTTEELKSLINDDFELFCLVFNINDFGHWEHGNYVLIQKESLAIISKEQNISLDQLKLKKKNWEKTLYHYREKRAKPRLDDKCLTSWNAIMLKGFVESFKALENENYLKIAKKNAHFILEKLWSSDGNLFHSYKNEKATINGFLEDYAFVIDAFIALYEATFEETWLEHAKNLTNYCLDHFYDETKQLFRFTSDLDESLIVAHFETEDNVIPASNSVMAENLFKLSVYFENSYYEKVARLMLEQVLPSIDYPSAFSNWLSVLLRFSDYQKELAICGENILEYLLQLNRSYLPHILLSGCQNNTTLPFLKNRFIENKTLFYLCQNKTCLAPTTNFEEVYKDLKN